MEAKGIYVGDISGTVYYTSNVENYTSVDWIPGAVINYTVTICIADEYGNVYYTSHHNDHQTINANGEISAEVINEHEYMF